MNTNQAERLEILSMLFQELNAAGIRYCDWKSTYELERGLKGETDLDLLLDRADAARFREMLLRCDFKPFVSAPQRQYSAVEDYIGLDRGTGALVHLHVHYRLILGEQYIKNYVIPLEHGFLNNTRLRAGLKVPLPELEIIVLVLRSLLKYRDRDVLRDLLRVPGRSGLPASCLEEFDDLMAQTDLDRIASAVKRHADFIPPNLIVDFLTTIRRSPRDSWALFLLRLRARQALGPYQRFGRMRAWLQYLRTMLAQEMPFRPLRSYLLADRHKKPATGGLGVALVGTDGAGKSTCVEQIAKWLSWRLNVYVFYMGTTHPSATSKIMRGISNTGQLVHTACERILGERASATRAVGIFGQFLTDLRHLSEGRDRYNRYLAAQRKIAQGAVVIYDRYPLTAASIDGHPLDGPRISASGSPEHRMFAMLAHAEENIYRRIRPPDHVLLLRVSPEVSQARKPEHRWERIEAKALAMEQFAHDGLEVTEIDAEQPIGKVLLQIKSAIWSWI